MVGQKSWRGQGRAGAAADLGKVVRSRRSVKKKQKNVFGDFYLFRPLLGVISAAHNIIEGVISATFASMYGLQF